MATRKRGSPPVVLGPCVGGTAFVGSSAGASTDHLIGSRVSEEAGITSEYLGYVGFKRASVGINRFGASAPGEEVLQGSGATSGNVANATVELLRIDVCLGEDQVTSAVEDSAPEEGRSWGLRSRSSWGGRFGARVEGEEVDERSGSMVEIQCQGRLYLVGGFARAGLCSVRRR
jgi:hypothetical protein